jgi:S-adenosylmethionine-dependent methyltransferase
MIKKIAKTILNKIRKRPVAVPEIVTVTVPDYLKRNQIILDDSQLKKIELSIRENYHQGWRSEKNYTSEAYTNDLRAHLIDRVETDRVTYIPWFNKTVQLEGANILEIGCGTGSSTIALAEQGAIVTGIDLDEGALKVARDRCEIYNVPVTIIFGNACDVFNQLQNQKFDIIIFYACVEHMVYKERIDCLRKYYDLLPNGSYLSIVETPNRLWYFDTHTSLLPFFHWLPNNVAFDYSRFSNRINFKELYFEHSDEKFLHFLRRGRGFSFHELEIALDISAEKFNVVDYIRHSLPQDSLDNEFHKLLTQINPKISKGFFYPSVDVIIKKSQLSD